MSVYEALQYRYSIRSYTGDPVPEEKLCMILRAGLMSESGHNKKSYELILALGMPAEKKPKYVPENLPAEKIHYGKF